MKSRDRAARQEFRVVLSGLELGDDQLYKVNAAIQQAALMAIADIDTRGDQVAAIIPISPKLSTKLPPWWDGGTWGIWWIDRLPGEEFERLTGFG